MRVSIILSLLLWLMGMGFSNSAMAGSAPKNLTNHPPALQERILLKQQQINQKLDAKRQKAKQNVRARWQQFKAKQAERPMMERYLRLCLLMVLCAIVLAW